MKLLKLLPVLTASLLSVGLTGCVNYSSGHQSTGSVNTPAATPAAPTARPEAVAGSHIPIVPVRIGHRVVNTAAPVSIYTEQEIRRSGATDLASFLHGLPEVH